MTTLSDLTIRASDGDTIAAFFPVLAGASHVLTSNLSRVLHNPLGCFAVPFRRDRAFFPLPCHQSCQRRRQLAWIGANEFVRPDRDGLGTFGVVAQSQAGYAQYGGLLGDATGIGNHATGMLYQVVEFQIAQWIDIIQLRCLAIEIAQVLGGAWMNGKYHWQAPRAFGNGM